MKKQNIHVKQERKKAKPTDVLQRGKLTDRQTDKQTGTKITI